MPRTIAGRSWQALIMGDGTGQEGDGSPGTGDYAPADWLAVSANTDAPDDTNTALPAEVAAGSLARAQATFGHTTGQSSYTLTHLFISDQEIEIAKLGVYNKDYPGGTLVFEELLENPASLVDLDQVSFTVTVTL